MARKRSEFLKGFGKAFEIFKALTDAVLERGGDDSDVERILISKNLRANLADLIVGAKNPALEVWKTIKLGVGLKTVDAFRSDLRVYGFRISDWARDILGKPAFSAADKETELDLVVVSVAELGFKDGATRKDTYKRAQDIGLELCPAEVGPQLRLQYADQPMNEWLRIGMEPITGSDGDLSVFDVGHVGSGLWLIANVGFPGRFWHADSRWVFVRPRK